MGQVYYLCLPSAQVAELVDALRSGRSVRKDVKVRLLSWVLFGYKLLVFSGFFCFCKVMVDGMGDGFIFSR